MTGNKHVIRERGWNPLKGDVLFTQKLEKTKPHDYMSETHVPMSLSVTPAEADTDKGDSEEEGDVYCCNGSLCKMPDATKLGPKDTHWCYTCKKRMHGGIFVDCSKTRRIIVVMCTARNVEYLVMIE